MRDTLTLLKGLEKFVEDRDVKKVRVITEQFHPSDLYKEIKDWPIEKAVLLLRLLTEEYASELFAEFTPKQQTDIIKMLTSEEIADLFEEMYTDEAVDILEELPANITHKILASTNKEQRAKINKILRYDIGKCGYHMVVEYVSIGDNLTIGQAKEIAKNQINEEDLEIIGNIFVSSSEDGRMIGYIKPDVLIAGKDEDMIIDEVERIDGVQSTDHISKAQALISQYDIPSIPVLDNNHVIVGIIEADDIIERYEDIEEASFDQSTINVINKSYLDVTNKELIFARLPWIVILLVVGSLSQIVIMGFQVIWTNVGLFSSAADQTITFSTIGVIAVTTAMSMFSSITDTAGNTGSQSASTLIRAIALGDVSKENYGKAIKKEFIVSAVIGFAAMVVSFLRIVVIWAIFGKFNIADPGVGHTSGEVTGWLMLIAFISSFTFFLTIVIGNLVGAGLPILADKVGMDGAIFAGPIQTTILDIVTTIIYFSLTTAIFVPLAQAGYFA